MIHVRNENTAYKTLIGVMMLSKLSLLFTHETPTIFLFKLDKWECETMYNSCRSCTQASLRITLRGYEAFATTILHFQSRGSLCTVHLIYIKYAIKAEKFLGERKRQEK